MAQTIVLCRVDGNFGGVERYILTLAQGLDRRLYHPIVVGVANQGELLRQAREMGLDAEFVPMTSRLHIRSAARDLERIVRKWNAVLLHTFGLRSNSIAYRLQRSHKLPWIVRLPNINSTDYNNPLRGTVSHWFNNFFIRQADALQVISPQLEKYVRNWRKPPKRVYTIHNGVDAIQFDRSQVKQTARKQFNLLDCEPLIGGVGRLEYIKGYDILIRAFTKIVERFPNAHLMLVGDGPERQNLINLAHSLEIENRIHIAGFCEDVRPFLAAFDLYVCSSRSEGVPMAMLEAMAMGLPTVSTQVGGIESVIEDGRTGFLISPENESILSEVIQNLLRNTDRMKILGQEARKRVLEYFSVDRMIENVQKMYRDIIAENML